MPHRYKIMILAVAIGLILPILASAVHAEDHPQTSIRHDEKTMEQTAKTNEAASRAASQVTEHRAKCEQRKSKIDEIMSRVGGNRENRVTTLNSITEKVKAFYVKKGYVLTNYDSLIATVNAKKAAAESAANNVKFGASFSCDVEKPHEAVEAFKQKRRGAIEAVHAYRESIRALIDGIKSVQKSSTTSGGAQ